MDIKIEVNSNITFMELLEDWAKKSIKHSDLWESVLGIDREELIKKSDYLYELLEDCPPAEGITEDFLREIICYENWGRPAYDDEGNETSWED